MRISDWSSDVCSSDLPFMVLPLYASLEKLDRLLIEAALDLGASQLHAFRTVVIPLALPGIVSGSILVFIPALGSFLTPDLLGGTDSQMIAHVIRSEEPRVGKEFVSTCSSRWAPEPQK